MRLNRRVSRLAAAAGCLLATATCTDVFTTPGVGNVALTYTGDTVIVVGGAGRASGTATVEGKPLTKPQFALLSSDTFVVAVHGTDSLVGKKRGTATLTVSLASSLLPNNPPSLTRTLRVVVDTVRLDSTSITFTSLGDTVRLSATSTDALGDALSGITPAWSSSDTAVVSVTATGRLLAKANGTAAVRAVVDFDTASAPVTVQQQLVRYTFEPLSVRLDALGATQTVTPTPRDARGNAIGSLPVPTFSSGSVSIATVTATGLVRSVANGSTFVYATRGSVTDSVEVVVDQRATQITITPNPVPQIASIGDQVQLAASAADRNGVGIQDAVPGWFSLDPAIVRVSSEGLVTGLSAGPGRVAATLDGTIAQVTVQVSNLVKTVEISPDTAFATSIQDTVVFEAVARNGRGDSIPGAAVAWGTPDAGVVNVLSNGRAVALQTGVARIIASASGHADTGVVRVTNSPATVNIVPDFISFTSVPDADTPQVVIKNARNAVLGRGSVSWTSDNTSIARVSPIGQISVLDTGQTFVRATSGLLTDSILVISQNVARSITIEGRAQDTLTALGQQLPLTVTVRNGKNLVIPRFQVTWRTTNRNVVDTVADNVATAVGFGSTLLVAQADQVADSDTVVVRNPTRLIVDNAVVVSPRFGTQFRPYARIQDAVNGADANDTIIIRRGTGSYSETVSLVRRLTLLGDSANFVSGGRNATSLPVIAHDTGAAAIIAHTTAPMTFRYLAVTHTLDGPALDADGSDVVLEWFYVNRPGSVSSNIGRGISIADSPSGTRITNTRVRNVRAYGIRLTTVSGALVQNDSIVQVDSLTSGGGAGIEVSGGSSDQVFNNTVRATQGPQILVQSAASASITSNSLAGRHQLVRVVSGSGNTQINNNTFDLRFQAGDDGSGSSFDGRSGLEVRSTPVFISGNTFTEGTTSTSPAMDGIRFINVRSASMLRNTYIGGFRNLRSDSSTVFSNLSAASGGFQYVAASGTDSIYLFSDTVALRLGGTCIDAEANGVFVFMDKVQLASCAANPLALGILVSGTGNQLSISNSTIAVAVSFFGLSFRASGSVFSGSGSTPNPSPFPAVRVSAETVDFTRNQVADFGGSTGVDVNGSLLLHVDSNRISRNRVGAHLGGAAPDFRALANDIYDNTMAGVDNAKAPTLNLTNNWWGDDRGPRGSSNAATGDTIVGFSAITSPVRTSPLFPGSGASSLRIVRGDNQTASAGSTLPKACTVRVVDTSGRPVSGVSVQFSVTGGGGNVGGQGNVTVVSNASGLAEATLTLGGSAGTNTVRVSASGGIQDIFFTATGT